MIKKHWTKRKYDYLSILILVLAVTLGLAWTYHWDTSRLDVPLAYVGSDEMSGLVNAKLFERQGWCMSTERLGAPSGANYYDFTVSMTHNFDLLTLKLCVMITGDAIKGYNVNIYLMYYLAALISYLVMRTLGIKRWIAVSGSLAFAFCPFIVMRALGHSQLAEGYFLPLSVLLCIWLYEREDVFCFNRSFFKNKKNWLMLLFIILIGSNGIAYYPFFTCYLLILTGLIKWIRTKRFRYMLKCCGAIAGIGVTLILHLLPGVFFRLQNGSNTGAYIRNGFVETELYGLKIIQLFLPRSGHGNEGLTNLIESYNNQAPLVTENITSYLGFLGVCGFIVLLLVFLAGEKNKAFTRMRFLGQLNIFMVLLAAGNGIGTIFAFLISDQIRGYNRISILITYVSLLGLCLFMNELSQRYNRYMVTSLGILLMCFGLWEQHLPDTGTIVYEAEFESDRKFVGQIEDSVEEGSMIYQLPYHEYPEGGWVNDMGQDHLFLGMIHSDTLRWSYGGVKGRENDLYLKGISELSVDKMVEQVKAGGFAGIYVDRRAYEEEELKVLEDQLKQYTKNQGIYSENGNLSFFRLQ